MEAGGAVCSGDVPFSVAILSAILLYTWVLDHRLPRDVVRLTIGLVAALGAWHSVRSGEWGFDRRAFLPGLGAVSLFTVPGVLVILLAGVWLGTIHDRRDFLGSLGGLLVWGGAQQWILQTVVLREAQRATSPRTGVVLAAALFAIVHLPNLFLTPVTLASGLAWSATYARYPNILPLAFSHGLGTLAILYAFDPALTGRLRIGYSYLLLDR
jgi:membrane protease YdiL (CAAX protease family)